MLGLDEGMLHAIVSRHVSAIRSDINNGYKAGVTLTQTVWYHRGAAEQADLTMEPMVTYFGDMVSFFDEELLRVQTRLRAVPHASDQVIR